MIFPKLLIAPVQCTKTRRGLRIRASYVQIFGCMPWSGFLAFSLFFFLVSFILDFLGMVLLRQSSTPILIADAVICGLQAERRAS